ncbi:hypothetical protein B1C78_01910 [Thioalkalivibrio denitrificans]|uniref:DUF432 domain-containing protein n=1 Tax=Thioalkalivibrio denitrificans TaxID=108003 RepID=A0A1V3NSN3_9GAMM|nr:DUF432 domain-containing protein [Thioalkalivibrio denitrificans]OOG28097.1 hypothetical protein B1C78_01910 [Thioalkalivibrio denitrificans]
MNQRSTDHWWSSRDVETGKGICWSLGPLTLSLFRNEDAWHMWMSRQEVDDSRPTVARVEPLDAMPADTDAERFVYGKAPGRVRLRPLLADRPVVVRARQPVFVPPGERTTLYLSTPVWLSIDLGDPARALKEVPVLRLSDTWFGPSTREGELCYAARTHARSHLDEVPRRPHRAVTPVQVRNEANTLLPIEKISVPVPLLSVYGDPETGLWTEEVHLTRSADSDLAALRIVPGKPSYAPRAERLSPPRAEPGRGGLVRAFSDLFG